MNTYKRSGDTPPSKSDPTNVSNTSLFIQQVCSTNMGSIHNAVSILLYPTTIVNADQLVVCIRCVNHNVMNSRIVYESTEDTMGDKIGVSTQHTYTCDNSIHVFMGFSVMVCSRIYIISSRHSSCLLKIIHNLYLLSQQIFSYIVLPYDIQSIC